MLFFVAEVEDYLVCTNLFEEKKVIANIVVFLPYLSQPSRFNMLYSGGLRLCVVFGIILLETFETFKAEIKTNLPEQTDKKGSTVL